MDKASSELCSESRDTAETYLEDGRCGFHNNLKGRMQSVHSAVGFENPAVRSSVDGFNASAVVYKWLRWQKHNDLNIYGYLKFLLEHRPSKDMTDEQLADLAPWSEKLQSIKNRM